MVKGLCDVLLGLRSIFVRESLGLFLMSMFYANVITCKMQP